MSALDRFDNEYDEDGFRTCSITELDIHSTAERYVKLFGVTAVIALVIGGIFALTVALTRWEVFNLISEETYYHHLSMHAWNILIFWMVFLEIAILYVGGPIVLGRKLPLPKFAALGYIVMVIGAVGINWAIWTTPSGQDVPLLTAYVPLEVATEFYAFAIIFLLGATIAALPFFAAIWLEKRGAPGKTLPLVTFGAFITAIIAVQAILGGFAAFGYAFLWRVGIIESINTGIYRQLYWIIGHGSQQINLLAMITVWYFLTHVVGGAVVVSEKVSRSAFVLYLFFINLGAAHHLMVDPGVSVGWRVFNTSYAFYGAAFASMIHAFAIPAGLEVGRRSRGQGGGLFGWLTSAPWRNPVFSSTIFSIILFGFVGGITGVLMGQLQLNMTWHNTFATVGHFHGTVALGTSLAFFGLVFFVIKTMFRRDYSSTKLAQIVPYFYAGAMGIAVLMMVYVGILYGVPRRTSEVVSNIPTADFNLAAAEPLFVPLGIGAILAIVAGALFVLVAVTSILFGKELDDGDDGGLLPDGGLHEGLRRTEADIDVDIHAAEMRGTFVMCLIFLATFVLLYVLNWFLLTQLWEIGA